MGHLTLSGIGNAGTAFSPDVLANLYLWVKSDKDVYKDSAFTSPATSLNDAVQGWKDQSGSGHDLTASVGQTPLLKPSVVNGKAGLLFDTSDDQFTIANAQTFNEFTLFLVASMTSYGSTQGTIFGKNASNSASTLYFASATLAWVSDNGGFSFTLAPAAISTGTFYIHTFYSGGNDYHYQQNGGTVVNAGAVRGPIFAPDRIGNRNSAQRPFGGQMAELLIYTASLSADDRAKVVGYLKTRYGIA